MSSDCGATLHQPIFEASIGAGQWSRHQPATLNLIDPDKSRRISAMDEVKRALDTAEQIAIDSVVLHLGGRRGQMERAVAWTCRSRRLSTSRPLRIHWE